MSTEGSVPRQHYAGETGRSDRLVVARLSDPHLERRRAQHRPLRRGAATRADCPDHSTRWW
ncbi:hypothetical protein CDG81_16250 [Actinopolyspora erythraea]|uniref:Uncharacterized protein n=1 Tax=Actinopolyspora erythraea TaxID=414996 RepID=A0A223RUP8_9ACTN|nr:hypothetical protein CDG81_16250 [Actinopolyspora erythraea]